MLVLMRRRGQKIILAENITVTVLEVRGETVRLGLEAPRDVPIWRAEIVPPRQSEPPRAG